ncbi:proprotein convertase P-domain-containing protein [Subsaxibacter sp. CAU 1640]|uniref:proprotein convertase P-domain-containing protein n=1 Tax=Subsaxibacter sp. CAU 1640 TaxID=2933271 RepID=UPI0020044A7D|nr:proprotein convertase P-domain-containing protein [Subsaxibacter sp. CAU 1640]MCK7589252.1 proprotein convertase P-domain-containing protein [Subsaxibacter sp. CAU 1640]
MQNLYKIFLKGKNCFLIPSVMFLVVFANAQKPKDKKPFEIDLGDIEKIETEVRGNMSINLNTGFPMAIYQVNFDVPEGSPEEMAQYYLQHQHEKLGIPQNDLQNLRHHATRTSRAGSVVRYRQYFGQYPVNKAEVTISISPQNKVVFVMNSYETNINIGNIQPNISAQTAYNLALNYLNITGRIMYTDNNLVIYKNTKMTRLAYEVVLSAEGLSGEWHVFIDAQTQQIFKAVDMAHYHKDKDKDKKNESTETADRAAAPVNGTGLVFNPDPLSSNQVVYGGGYVDGNDAATTQLNNARFNVVLRDIDLTAGVYKLKGPRAEIIDFEGPTTGLFTQTSSVFNFNRQEQGFEAVNAYYHIDYMMGYVNETLGLNITPYQYNGGVRYDPHAANGADNSYYTSGAGRLAFGEGCVDDAEDSDVIHHELGHGLHDWVTSGSLSQVNGLSEGCGDYIAQSYNRSLGNWTSANPQYNWVFNWDGHNPCWNGRITNYTAVYPSGLVGQIHTDGQIWSSCLMGIWDQIGQQEMDLIFYEGLAMTNSSSNQNDAANAVYQAALSLNYTQQQLVAIHDSLEACGYTLPALPGPPIVSFSADNSSICLDNINTVNFMDTSSPAGTSWLWTFEGGTPATSTVQNPIVTYASEGTYNVTLSATNSYGTTELTETDFITVLSGDDCPACTTQTNNTPIAISSGAGATYNSTMNVTGGGDIIDVNVTIDITHTWNADLDIFLISPSGTMVELTSDNGGIAGQNYTNTVFDQQATTPITSGTSPFTGTFIPEGNLSSFNGQNASGNWTLRVIDDASQDGGQLNFWRLELCVEPPLSVAENVFEGFSIFPNPNNGSFNIKLNSPSSSKINIDVFDIRGREIFKTSYTNTANFNQNINLNNVQSGIYMVQISDGEKKVIKKIIIE